MSSIHPNLVHPHAPHLHKPNDLNAIHKNNRLHQYDKKKKNSSHKTVLNPARHTFEISRRDCKEKVNIFLKKSSLYALHRIGMSKTIKGKTFWSLILIAGIIGIVWEVSSFLAAYLSYPVVVNRESATDVFLKFPAVTVCNINRIQNEFLLCLERKLTLDECFPLTDRTETKLSAAINFSDPLCKAIPNSPSNSSKDATSLLSFMSQRYELRVMSGHQAKDFIKSCYFNGIKCGVTDFKHSSNKLYGNCYTFSSGNSNRIILIPGPESGLHLELDIEIHKYASFTAGMGARVRVHDPFTDPDINIKGVNVGPGFETHVVLSKSVMLRLPPPYKDGCKTYEHGDNKISCKRRCLDSLSLSQCSCVLFDKTRGSQCNIALPSVRCCMLKVTLERVDMCHCPVSCEETTFNTQISSIPWPSPAYYVANQNRFLNGTKDAGNVLSLEDVRRTRLKLRIYCDTLDYTIIRKSVKYESSEVLSQIGGQIGLWLGLSLVAIFELFANLTSFCIHKKTRKKLLATKMF